MPPGRVRPPGGAGARSCSDSKANKPRWARGAVGGTLFTFKTYSSANLELMQRMWSTSGPRG